MTTHMTAQAAADALHDAVKLPVFARQKVREWLAANWPAGGAVKDLTGQRLYETIHGDAGPYVLLWSQLEPYSQQRYDRAAARLSAPQPVAFDVEAVAREIAGELVGSSVPFMQNMHEENVSRVTSVLRRHADAPATGVQWVRRAEGTLATIADPRDSNSDAVQLFCETVNGDRFVMTAGQWPPQRECARWSADGETWHRRTPATAGGWTASSVEACVGRNVVEMYDDRSSCVIRNRIFDAATIAKGMNREGVTAYYILPPVEGQP